MFGEAVIQGSAALKAHCNAFTITGCLDYLQVCLMVFRAIILKRGYAWSALTTTTTMS